jgi:alpha-L-rhamnosidase
MKNPEGIVDPNFSWQLNDHSIGAGQKSWQIQIASSRYNLYRGKIDIWSSNEQFSSDQLHIVPPATITFHNGTKYWWRVRIRKSDNKLTSWSQPASFSIGLSGQSWRADWITADWENCKNLPYLRKEFNLKEKPERAVVYLCALGCGDLFVNGKLADESRVLDPAQTNYEQYALYSTYDVTSKLKSGKNCIGVMPGDGWYHQNRVWGQGFSYGMPKIRLQLEITYKDGRKEIISSDPTWRWSEGPVTSSNIYAGECYDARKEIEDWCKPGTTDGVWLPALTTGEHTPLSLHPQMMDPIRLTDAVPARKIWKDKNGNWIIDAGENRAAVPMLNVSCPKGTRIKLRMGECLNPDSTINFGTTGVFATGVIQTDEYICNGKNKESWTPRFTYHGYRYIEVSGLPYKPDKNTVRSIPVYSAVRQIGNFSCGNDIINHLHELAVRTFLSNIHGIPTDCPHRERCGWLGDAHTVAPSEMMNRDMENFYIKYMGDVNSSADSVEKNALFHKLYNKEFYHTDKPIGISYMIAPGRRQCGVASPDWGTAQVQIPWDIYWYYGNKEALAGSYDYMKIWTDHVTKISENYIVPYGLGDWCGPDSLECPVALSSTAFHYRDVYLMEKTARLLGETEDAERYAGLKVKIAEAFIKKFYDKNKKTFGSQTGDAMALDFGLVPSGEERKVAEAIIRDAYERHNGFIHAGIFGMARIGQVLSKNGLGSEAWKLFTKTGEPSFTWMWKEADATTLWEILPIDKKNEEICLKENWSLNHPMQGGYDTWFYENVAGLRPVEAAYKKIRFERIEGLPLNRASASIITPYGKASSSWKSDGKETKWKIVIPANTTGEVILSAGKTILVNGRKISNCQYIRKSDIPVSGNEIVYNFPSGTFQIFIE